MNAEEAVSQTAARRRKLSKMIKLTFTKEQDKRLYKVDDLLEFIPNGTTLGEMVAAFKEVGATVKFIAKRKVPCGGSTDIPE